MTETEVMTVVQSPPGLLTLDDVPVLMGDEEFPVAREAMWDRIGTPISQEGVSLDVALKTTHLDGWDVELTPLEAVIDGAVMPVPGKYAITRKDHPTKRTRAMSVVGAKYRPLQNEEAFAWTSKVAENGNPYVSGGEAEDGAKVFLVQRMAEPVNVPGIDLFLMSRTTHDGSGSLEAGIVPMGRVSQSAMNVTLAQSKRLWKVRHTANALERAAEAKRALSLIQDYRFEFEEYARRMIHTTVNAKQFRDFTRELFPLSSDAGKRMKSMTANKRRTLAALYYSSPTLSDEYRETAWGVMHAVTEYVDWFAQVRKAEGDPYHARAVRALINGSDVPLKDRAVDLLRKM